MEYRNILANRLKEMRTKRGLSQKELAEKVGCTNKNISTYEKAFRTPEYDTLIGICKALRCSSDYLLGIVDDPNTFSGNVDGHYDKIIVRDDAQDKPYTKEQFENIIHQLQKMKDQL